MTAKSVTVVVAATFLALAGIALAQVVPGPQKQQPRATPAVKPRPDNPAVDPVEEEPKLPMPKRPTKVPTKRPPPDDPVILPREETDRGGQQTITGRAVTKDGKGIGGIEVSAVRNGAAVGGGATSDDEDDLGAFSFDIPSGSPVTLRFLKSPDYDPAVVFELSGRHAQNITQVVYEQGEERSELAKLATKMAKEFIAK